MGPTLEMSDSVLSFQVVKQFISSCDFDCNTYTCNVSSDIHGFPPVDNAIKSAWPCGFNI